MEDKFPTYRLGISLLALALVFLGLQSLDLMPNVSAQVNVSSRAALVALSHIPSETSATSDTHFITGWNTILNQPGVYQLYLDISGTSGPAITIVSDDVTVLGNGHSITGDGMFDYTPMSVDHETGIQLGAHSNVTISGVDFQNLDFGVDAFIPPLATVNNIQIDNSAFSNSDYYAIRWQNYGTAANVDHFSDTVVGSSSGGVYWHNDDTGQASNVTFGYNYLSNNGIFDIEWSGQGLANSVIVSDNTFASGNSGFELYNDGSAYDILVDGNSFYDYSHPVSVYNEDSADTIGGLKVQNNTIDNSGAGVYVANWAGLGNVQVSGNYFGDCFRSYIPGVPLGNINLFGGGKGIIIQGNTIYNSTDMAGIRFAGNMASEQPRPFYDIEIRDNWIGGLDGDDSTGSAPGIHFFNYSGDAVADDVGLKIRDNSFVTNSGPGISYTVSYPAISPTSIDGRMNWWGDPAGPSGPSGDGVSAGVIFDPWTTTAPTATVSVSGTTWSVVGAGGDLPYTIVVDNDGGAPAFELVVVSTPMSATVKSYSGSPLVAGDIVTWTLPALGPMSSVTFTLTVEVSPTLTVGEVIANTIQIRANGGLISDSISVETTITEWKKVYLPLVLRNH